MKIDFLVSDKRRLEDSTVSFHTHVKEVANALEMGI